MTWGSEWPCETNCVWWDVVKLNPVKGWVIYAPCMHFLRPFCITKTCSSVPWSDYPPMHWEERSSGKFMPTYFLFRVRRETNWTFWGNSRGTWSVKLAKNPNIHLHHGTRPSIKTWHTCGGCQRTRQRDCISLFDWKWMWNSTAIVNHIKNRGSNNSYLFDYDLMNKENPENRNGKSFKQVWSV